MNQQDRPIRRALESQQIDKCPYCITVMVEAGDEEGNLFLWCSLCGHKEFI